MQNKKVKAFLIYNKFYRNIWLLKMVCSFDSVNHLSLLYVMQYVFSLGWCYNYLQFLLCCPYLPCNDRYWCEKACRPAIRHILLCAKVFSRHLLWLCQICIGNSTVQKAFCLAKYSCYSVFGEIFLIPLVLRTCGIATIGEHFFIDIIITKLPHFWLAQHQNSYYGY